jgi:hypothetical protein
MSTVIIILVLFMKSAIIWAAQVACIKKFYKMCVPETSLVVPGCTGGMILKRISDTLLEELYA